MLIGAGEIITRSFKLYQENARLFLKYSFLIIVPLAILLMGGAAAGLTGLFTGAATNAGAGLGAGIAIAVIAFIVFLYFAFWFSFALIRVIAKRYAGEAAAAMGEELKSARATILPGLLVSILSGLIVLGGFILFIIPGVIFSIWFYFSMYLVILDGHKPMDAIRASKQLVVGRWWAVLWRLFAPAVVFLVLTWLAELVLTMPFALAWSKTSIAFSTVGTFISGILQILLAPLFSAGIIILFLELKKTPAPVQTPAPLPPSQPAT